MLHNRKTKTIFGIIIIILIVLLSYMTVSLFHVNIDYKYFNVNNNNNDNGNNNQEEKKASLTLYGDKQITLYIGDTYSESGFLALDGDKKNINNKVKVESNLKTDTIGTYTITYTLKTDKETITLTRTIKVIKRPIENVTFKLNGNSEINIYLNEEFTDPRYTCINENTKEDLSKYVTVNNPVNTKIIGTYKITYTLKVDGKTQTLTRTVNVIKKPVENITFQLKGSSVIDILLNEQFNDPLYTCIDNDTNKDLSKYVKVSNPVNNKVAGSYTITYTLTIDGKTQTLTRKVNVLSKKYQLLTSTEALTNQNVQINFTSYISNFAYTVTPDNKKNYSKTLTYAVSQNGTYKFTVYDTNNKYETYSVTINNIDKTAPVITACSAVISNNQTTFNITSSSTDIAKFVVNNNTFYNKMHTLSGVIENGQVVVFDKANNSSTFRCNSYYKEISPTGNENIIQNASTDTLKVWIEKTNRSSRTDYYTTHIWVKNAYNQFKAQLPENFGKEVLLPQKLLSNAISQNSLQNKLVVAINASGFIKNGSYGQKFYDVNPGYNLTSGSPIVVYKGNVLRDYSGGTLPESPYKTYGLKKSGELAYYVFVEGTGLQQNINAAKQIVSDGVLNTFAFRPILVVNGQISYPGTTKDIRQGICQIDKNNFVFITDIYSSSRDGFSYTELSEYMISLGCKTGFNLDGGGSTTLLFKNKNSSSSNVITGNSRQIADIIYFTE